MERIKSAFEIAMEKADKLGKASTEELREMKEAEYASLGQAIAKRYLGGQLEVRQVEAELNRLQDGRDTVRKAIIGGILGSLPPEEPDRAIEAITVLAAEKEGAKEAADELRSITREYAVGKEQVQTELKEKLERPVRQELSQLGISGSAIQVGVESHPQWLLAKEEMAAQFRTRLDEIKGRLLGQ